jgi:hypothetical protein
MGTVDIIGEPLSEIPDLTTFINSAAGVREPYGARPDDNLSAAADAVGRVNASYDHIWKAVREAQGKWITIRCNSMRRAVLLASAAIQHRTQGHDVSRRGRMVFIRLMQTSHEKTA